MNEKIRITRLYESLAINLIKFILLNVLLVLIAYEFINGEFPRVYISLLSALVILHIFIKYYIGNIVPSSKISTNPPNIMDSFTKEALLSFFNNKSSETINRLLKLSQSKFFLEKAAIDPKNVIRKDIPVKDLISKAPEIAKTVNGKYITTTDLLSAYLLLTEEETKLLFNSNLKEKDVININKWARIISEEEDIKERKARFVGIGFGETLVWGWTPETQNYTRDLTFSSVKKKAFVEGRETEYRGLLDGLSKDHNNNVLLVGEIGTGKNNLVDNLIYDSYEANLSKKLNHRRFLEIMIGPLVAGATNREDLEKRLQSMIEEVKHSGNIYLYIPEFQNILGASSYGIDLSGALLPYLKDGKMPIIATMTHGEYKKYFENSALREVFTVIKLEEPNHEQALNMLFQKSEEIEEETKVSLSYKAVLAGVNYADKYDVNAVLPGTAVELLTEAANSVFNKNKKIVLEEDVIEKVEQKSHIPVGKPKSDEKLLLLNLENELHKFVIGQDEAVRSISEAMRRIRAGISRERPISFLFLGPTGVGKTETARSLAKIYFGGQANMIRADMSEYGTEDGLAKLLESDSNSFLDQVTNNPFSLILLDEFEKANEKIQNLFLQVLEDGRMTDNNGKTISFTNTIIIVTSNAGSEFIRESLQKNSSLTQKDLLDYLQKNAIFRPELLNRFDDIVMFKPLNQSEILLVTKLLLGELSAKMAEQDITVSFENNAVDQIGRGGFSEEFGARPLRRYIQDKVEDVMAKKILSGEINRGDKISVNVDSSSNLSFAKA